MPIVWLLWREKNRIESNAQRSSISLNGHNSWSNTSRNVNPIQTNRQTNRWLIIRLLKFHSYFECKFIFCEFVLSCLHFQFWHLQLIHLLNNKSSSDSMGSGLSDLWTYDRHLTTCNRNSIIWLLCLPLFSIEVHDSAIHNACIRTRVDWILAWAVFEFFLCILHASCDITVKVVTYSIRLTLSPSNQFQLLDLESISFYFLVLLDLVHLGVHINQ